MDTVDWYRKNATSLAATYEALEAVRVHAWLIDVLPEQPRCILDVGAGSGRDAAWFASLGHDVVAVEPAEDMIREARRRHPHPAINWVVGDRLPGLETTMRLGKSFDLILLSAVWMHVAPADRPRALRKLTSLLNPGGRIAITLRHGPPSPGQIVHEVSVAEIEAICRACGAYVERCNGPIPDLRGRADVTWTEVLVRLPDDGAGALPMLRSIVINDSKDSTYKLGLLRSLCRIADGAAGFARGAHGSFVALPLGLVGLYWLRLYKPLLAAGLPQRVDNLELSRLGFVRDGFRKINPLSQLDLRIGMRFGADWSPALHDALKDACHTIAKMPANFITNVAGEPVFPVERRRAARPPGLLCLDEAYLASFGDFLVPENLWLAFQRHAVWIEPAIEAEWIRLMHGYALRQGRQIIDSTLHAAMLWSDPGRDVSTARKRALHLLESGDLRCTWTDKSLTAATLDMDHCFPWSVWPCEDLWNLFPVHRVVNQQQKRNLLPAAARLRQAQDRIQGWWEHGYRHGDQSALRIQFDNEAKASLPIVGAGPVNLDDVFSGVMLQQMRLRHDQQVPLWT
jgi:SAM-dependent methyltransferase